jgi:hypothetical protein
MKEAVVTTKKLQALGLEALKLFQGILNTGVTWYADIWQNFHLYFLWRRI